MRGRGSVIFRNIFRDFFKLIGTSDVVSKERLFPKTLIPTSEQDGDVNAQRGTSPARVLNACRSPRASTICLRIRYFPQGSISQHGHVVLHTIVMLCRVYYLYSMLSAHNNAHHAPLSSGSVRVACASGVPPKFHLVAVNGFLLEMSTACRILKT